jgi:hypothetical protein
MCQRSRLMKMFPAKGGCLPVGRTTACELPEVKIDGLRGPEAYLARTDKKGYLEG